MEIYWTVEQAQANAEVFAQEFSNRQILIYGFGEPSAKAPIGAEYEDRSILPPIRYRKTGENDEDWTAIKIIEVASTDEVANGVNNEKMITPAMLSVRLNSFAQEVLNIPTSTNDDTGAAFTLSASTSLSNSEFDITLEQSKHDTISIQLANYGANSKLKNIIGGEIGQVVMIRRAENQAFTIESSQNIKLSTVMVFDDISRLNNISLQRVSSILWLEIGRKKFTP